MFEGFAKIVNECTRKECVFKPHLNRYLRPTIARMLSKRERPKSATLKFNGNTYGSMYGQQLRTSAIVVLSHPKTEAAHRQ